jgi:hypothetical protein
VRIGRSNPLFGRLSSRPSPSQSTRNYPTPQDRSKDMVSALDQLCPVQMAPQVHCSPKRSDCRNLATTDQSYARHMLLALLERRFGITTMQCSSYKMLWLGHLMAADFCMR